MPPIKVSQLILQLRKEWPERAEGIEKIAEKIDQVQTDLNAARGTLGWDLVCFRAKQMLLQELNLSAMEISAWDRLWATTTKPIEHESGLLYNPPSAYTTMLASETAFDQLADSYKQLVETSGNRIREDFLTIFFRVRASMIPHLTPSERKVFLYVVENQTVSPTEIAKNLGTTKGYISRVLRTLREKRVIAEFFSFSYTALKLKVLNVVIEMDSLDAQLPDMFTRKNPWLYNVFESKMGKRFAIANFIVPVSWRSASALRTFAEKLTQFEHITSAKVLQRKEASCWRHYNYREFNGSEWQITAGTYSPRIRAGFKKQPTSLQIQALQPDMDGFILDDLDIRIIETLYKYGPLTIRQLREFIGRDYNLVLSRYSDLVRRHIIETRAAPNPLFAPGMVVVMAQVSDEEHLRLCNAFSCLPEAYLQRTKEGYTICTLRLPEAYVRDVVRDANDILAGKERWLTYHGNMHFFNWTLPVERWLSGYREWWIHDNDFEGVT
ncbi:MAG: MarR family transcriptional regulator [Candidatus Thorarchaeota archaeon]